MVISFSKKELTPIPGYEGFYSVTKNGDIWSHPKLGGSSKKLHAIHDGKWLKPRIQNSGYLFVTLYKDGNRIGKNMLVHRIVASVFIQNNDHKKYVNHIDGDKTNNKSSNLEWVTFSQNMKHAYEKGLCVATDKKINNAAKIGKRNRLLSISDAIDIRKKYRSGFFTQKSIADEYGVSFQLISDIVRNKTYNE